MLNMNIPVVKPWSLRIPRMIRYLSTKLVEEFFESGNIMLTTYERCRRHEDLTRKDSKEGRCNFSLTHGDIGVDGIHTVGTNSYMLCGSTTESDDLMLHFSTDNYFIIHDIIGFSDAISRYIPGFIQGRFGNCVYKEQRQITKNTSKPTAPDHSTLIAALQKNQMEDIEREFYGLQQKLYNNIESEILDEAYFVKETSYQKEAEFRIIWTTPYRTQEPFHITCPEAIRFCSRREDLSRNLKPAPSSADGNMSIIMGSTKPQE